MIRINADIVKSKEKDLINFRGWLPMQFMFFIDMNERINFLEKEKINHLVIKENYLHRVACKASGDYYKYYDEKLAEWIEKNPYFKDCVYIQR